MSDTEDSRASIDSSDSWTPEDGRHDTLSAAFTSPSQRLLNGTSMPDNSKRRVDLATAGEGLSGKRCLIENTDEVNVVHYAHCLARRTKSHILDALEFSWGMSHRTLNLDTRYNVFRLGSKFHALYDKTPAMCILLPEERIIQQYYDARNDRDKFPDINEATYKYNFLAHDEMVSVPVHRLTPHHNSAVPPAVAYAYHPHPYTTLEPVISHVHPRFVICDAGKKLEGSFTRALAFSRLHPTFERALEMVAEIWKSWTSAKDSPDFQKFRRKPYTGDNTSSTSKRTSARRLFPSIGKRHGNHNESSHANKRSKKGQGESDSIWLDDETLREHDSEVTPEASWKCKKALIVDWAMVVSYGSGAVKLA